MKIRNKKTGEVKEIDEKEVAAYGLSIPPQKKSKKKKAQDGLTMPKEQDYGDNIEAYQEALDAYWNSVGIAQQNFDITPGISPIPREQRLQTSTSRFQNVKNQIPSVDAAFKQAGRDLSQPTQNPIKNRSGFNWGHAAVTALSIADTLIPEDEIKPPVVFPKTSYNQNQYGIKGSQAIAQYGANIKSYNPRLAAKDASFQKWYSKNTLEGQNKIPYTEKLDYDYFSFYKNSGTGSIDNHFPDTYKRPNHATFSNESIYSIPENTGGSWNGDKFIPKSEDGIEISTTGYKANSKDRNKPKLRIPSNRITMKNVPHPVIGTGSDGQQIVMMPEQEYVFPNAEYVDEQPIAQDGRRVPITTNNPNDPRLRAYNDSLTSYNWTQNRLKKGDLNPDNGVLRLNDINPNIFEKNEPDLAQASFGKIRPIKVRHYSSDSKGEQYIMDYKKPVQPVVYQKEPQEPVFKKPSPIQRTQTGDVNINTQRPSLKQNVELPEAFDYRKPSPFSFTYPTGPYNEQESIYFPDEKLLRSFAEGQNTTSIQSSGKGATATGNLRQYKKGGKMKGKYISKSYNDGGNIEIENNDFQPISEDTLVLKGDKHSNGGQMIQANGMTVEAEGGETMHRDAEGNIIIGGNLKNSLTGKKFKEDFKMIGKKEAKLNKLLDYSTNLVNSTNPYDKWENLKFNAGKAMMTGAKMKSEELLRLKEHLSDLQDASIALKKEGSETAKNGVRIAQRGKTIPGTDRRVTQKGYLNYLKSQNKSEIAPVEPFDIYTSPASMLNPDQYLAAIFSNEGGETGIDPPIKGKASGKYALMPATQKDVYNRHFKSKMSWEDFKKGYDTDPNFEYQVARTLAQDKINENKTAADALGSWYHPLSIKNKTLDQVPRPDFGNKLTVRQYIDRAAKNYFGGNNTRNPNSIYGPSKEETPQTTESQTYIPENINFNPVISISDRIKNMMKDYVPPKTNTVEPGPPLPEKLAPLPQDEMSGTDAEGLQFTQVLPEIYAAATNQEEPVWLQQYNPELYQPYNVSLQDRRNRIQSTGRATRQYLQDNANAQAVLAAQEYDAVGGVDAEEFRINQGIAQDITNKNKALLNESQLKNLQLADTQYTRQATGRSKTKATNQAILNSVSNKVLQNQLENRTLQVYENMYPHFRYNEQYQLKKDKGANPVFNTGLTPIQGSTAENTSTTQTFDNTGNVIRTRTNTPSELETRMDKLKLSEQELKAMGQPFNMQNYFNKRKSSASRMGLSPGYIF